MSRLKVFFLILLIAFAITSQASATVTYAVGNCRPGLPTFTTISAALGATPAPNVVMVCPGTYNEQITIANGVTLEGVVTGDSDQAIIAPPAGGLTQTATDTFGDTLFFQLWVNNASGPVNISNLTIDGSGNGVTSSGPFVVGIFYQNSPGTLNRVITRNQKGNSSGIGIDVEGGSTNPTVTIENSSIHDFDALGIQTSSGLSATIKGNEVTSNVCGSFGCQGITLISGTNMVMGNLVSAAGKSLQSGIQIFSNVAGAATGNTVMNSGVGINTGADGVSITFNKILNVSSVGIDVSTSAAAIQGNNITNTSVGIDFECNANPNVRSNTIMDATNGIAHVPSSVVTPNMYFSVGTIRSGC
jgi:hypothetical protein